MFLYTLYPQLFMEKEGEIKLFTPLPLQNRRAFKPKLRGWGRAPLFGTLLLPGVLPRIAFIPFSILERMAQLSMVRPCPASVLTLVNYVNQTLILLL